VHIDALHITDIVLVVGVGRVENGSRVVRGVVVRVYIGSTSIGSSVGVEVSGAGDVVHRAIVVVVAGVVCGRQHSVSVRYVHTGVQVDVAVHVSIHISIHISIHTTIHATTMHTSLYTTMYTSIVVATTIVTTIITAMMAATTGDTTVHTANTTTHPIYTVIHTMVHVHGTTVNIGSI